MSQQVFFHNFVTKSLTLEETKSGDRIFKGVLSVEMKDRQGEIMVIDELMKVVGTWLKRGGNLSDTHSNRHIGKGLNYQRVKIKDHDGSVYDGIEITGMIFKDYELDDDIWNKMKSGEYKGLSFGGATKSDRIPTIWKDGSVAYKLVDLEMYEVAVCKEAAVPLAIITDVNMLAKSIKKHSKQFSYHKRDDGVVIQCTNMGCIVEKSSLINKPMGQYSDFASCVAANKDKDNPEAYCGYIKHQTEDKEKSVGEKIGQTDGELEGYGESSSSTTKSLCPKCGLPIEKCNCEKISKGLVEDQASDKCEHCGYIPSDGKETLEQHMQSQHKELLEDPKQQQIKEESMDGSKGELDTEKQTENETPELENPNPDEPRPQFDNGIKFPSDEERMGLLDEPPMPNIMIDTPVDKPINEKPYMTQDQLQDPHDGSTNTKETDEKPGAASNRDFKEDEGGSDGKYSFDHTGTGREGNRVEDQNLKPEDSKDEDESEDKQKSKIFSFKETGYVSTPITKQCGTCEYFRKPDICSLPMDRPVDPVNGCCNFWSAKDTIEKGGKVVSQEPKYTDMQPQTSQVTPSVKDPDERISNQGDFSVGINKSPEQVPKEDAINWWNIMNPSQRQHAMDPNNWYDWSDNLSRNNYEELEEDDQKLVFSTYAFRNDGKIVEGADMKQLIPEDEGIPRGDDTMKNQYSYNSPVDNTKPSENDNDNINTTPTPMQTSQQTNQPDEKVKSISRDLKILELKSKLKSIV